MNTVLVPSLDELPTWLAEALREVPAAQDLFSLQFRMDYAWLESNETAGPGAHPAHRRAAYDRYSALVDPTFAASRRLADRFLAREVVAAAMHLAYGTFQRARALLLARADVPDVADAVAD